jgi:hypothetical protein
MIRISALLAGAIFAAGLALPAHAEVDWQKVDAAIGRPGAAQPGNVHRYGLPRSDLKVTLDGVEIKPGLALGSWLAFKAEGDDAMVMGDLVLTQDEVNPVMLRLAQGSIDITALHNHLLRSTPATMYMHVSGHGDPLKLAATLHEALTLSKTPLGAPPAAAAPVALDLDTAAIDTIIGFKGKANGPIYSYALPRAEALMDGGMELSAAMGSAIAINFQPTGNGTAAIAGDFVLVASEVNPVLRAFRENGIEVTAIHNHMLNDEPRLFFMHFWAHDDAAKLAHGLKAALDATNVARS